MATVQEIHQAAAALEADGKRPTLAAVRTRLGGGSFTTISEAMRSYKAAQAVSDSLAAVTVPPEIESRTRELQGAIWSAATEIAEARLAAEREALNEAQQAAADAQADAAEAVATLEAEAADDAKAIAELRSELQTLREAMTAETAAHATTTARLADAQATLAALVEKIPVPSPVPSEVEK